MVESTTFSAMSWPLNSSSMMRFRSACLRSFNCAIRFWGINLSRLFELTERPYSFEAANNLAKRAGLSQALRQRLTIFSGQNGFDFPTSSGQTKTVQRHRWRCKSGSTTRELSSQPSSKVIAILVLPLSSFQEGEAPDGVNILERLRISFSKLSNVLCFRIMPGTVFVLDKSES